MRDDSFCSCECGECQRRLEDIETSLSFWQQRLYKATSDMLLVVYQDLECGDVEAAQEDVRTFLELLAGRTNIDDPVDFEVQGNA